MNKHQGVTQCTPSASDATSWDHRLSALEGMMSQVIAAMTKNNASQIVAEMTTNQEEVISLNYYKGHTKGEHKCNNCLDKLELNHKQEVEKTKPHQKHKNPSPTKNTTLRLHVSCIRAFAKVAHAVVWLLMLG